MITRGLSYLTYQLLSYYNSCFFYTSSVGHQPWNVLSMPLTLPTLVRHSPGGCRRINVFDYLNKMPFSRPAHIQFPTIWGRFSSPRGPLRIQDLTEDLHQTALDLLTKYFTRDEPPCKYIGIQNHPTALGELQKLWTNTVKDNLSLVCVVDDDELPPKMVGVNVLTVVSKEDKEEPFHTEDKVWAKLFGAVDLVGKSVDIFQRYSVNKYLTAYGLVVDPQWRGCGVGQKLLEARIPLCRALDIKVTATVFTAGASQAVAKKAGFVDLFEITYEELAKKGFIFPGVEKDTKSSKLMAMVIVE